MRWVINGRVAVWPDLPCAPWRNRDGLRVACHAPMNRAGETTGKWGSVFGEQLTVAMWNDYRRSLSASRLRAA